ncbi:MAG TPA: hypothetical protein ENK52_02135, partial [Saprospiraceae bacterium]|nr:hypothetical protein [Saprospiraceae bacterium]
MKNLLFKTAIKWLLIYFGIGILVAFLAIALADVAPIIAGILSFFTLFFSLVLYLLAILDYSKKRNHLATPKEIFGLVGLIYIVPMAIGGIAMLAMA